MNYELIMFENSGVELEVNVSPEQETVWLTQEQIALLFGKSRSTITDHIRNIFEEGELKESTSVGNSDKTNHRPAKLYNLDVVLAVGHKVKSQNGVVFGKWAKDTLLLLKYKSLHSKSNLVRFEKGDLSLDVTVVPDDETVYLSKEQF